MAKYPKLRPSLDAKQILLISKALNYYIANKHSQGSAKEMNTLVEMVNIKRYLDDYVKDTNIPTTNPDQIIAEFLASQNKEKQGSKVQQIETELDSLPAEFQAEPEYTSIIHSQLTDEQKYHVLKTKDESELTEEEQVWMLNTGTLVMMRMASKGDKPVKPSDL